VIVEESNERGGWGAQVAADLASRVMEHLKGPILRVAGPNVPVPYTPVLEQTVIPDEDKIVDAVLSLF
jgi:pyruvate/2-oxoglutarate/acetoin dehydrogenase E1 component